MLSGQSSFGIGPGSSNMSLDAPHRLAINERLYGTPPPCAERIAELRADEFPHGCNTPAVGAFNVTRIRRFFRRSGHPQVTDVERMNRSMNPAQATLGFAVESPPGEV